MQRLPSFKHVVQVDSSLLGESEKSNLRFWVNIFAKYRKITVTILLMSDYLTIYTEVMLNWNKYKARFKRQAD